MSVKTCRPRCLTYLESAGERSLSVEKVLSLARFAVLGLFLVWLGSTAAGSEASAPATVRFVADPVDFTAAFGDGSVRLLFADGRDITLPQVSAGAVVRYSDGETQLTVAGGVARLEFNGLVYLAQAQDGAVDPWERARRAGVGFRAIGQEPGWMADIWDGERIELLLDYGDTRITTPISSAEHGQDGQAIVYRTNEDYGAVQLTVTITPGPCFDSMSGEAFPASVVVQIAGSPRKYTGCGRWLQ